MRLVIPTAEGRAARRRAADLALNRSALAALDGVLGDAADRSTAKTLFVVLGRRRRAALAIAPAAASGAVSLRLRRPLGTIRRRRVVFAKTLSGKMVTIECEKSPKIEDVEAKIEEKECVPIDKAKPPPARKSPSATLIKLASEALNAPAETVLDLLSGDWDPKLLGVPSPLGAKPPPLHKGPLSVKQCQPALGQLEAWRDEAKREAARIEHLKDQVKKRAQGGGRTPEGLNFLAPSNERNAISPRSRRPRRRRSGGDKGRAVRRDAAPGDEYQTRRRCRRVG